MGALQTVTKHAALMTLTILAVMVAGVFDASPALAHCDGLDGPVVNAARLALQTGDLNRVLIWVRPEDSGLIKRAFEDALAVRNLGSGAQALADEHFFETLVRMHRAGEGAPYTGLKPAGRDLGPAIPMADKAVETDSVEPVVRLLTEAVGEGLRQRFHQVIHKKTYVPDDVAAGRAYIAAYVEFIHYVERIYRAAVGQGHDDEAMKKKHVDEHGHSHVH